MNIRSLALLSASAFISIQPTVAATFYPIASVEASTAATDLWPASNLIQGAGVGFDAAEPHLKTSFTSAGTWVTADPGGFPSDYIAVAGTPVITLDLGQNQLLSEISIWGYAATNHNGASAFELKFASEADGTGGFGTSIADNPSFSGLSNDDTIRQSFAFAPVTARYVELTVTDTFFVAPGDGTASSDGLAGGDRVGLGEIAFAIVPEPSAFTLGAIGLLLILRRRSRNR